jgi:hypothetical protein
MIYTLSLEALCRDSSNASFMRTLLFNPLAEPIAAAPKLQIDKMNSDNFARFFPMYTLSQPWCYH